MNIDFKLKLPLINKEDETDKTTLLVSAQLMLNPLYALESDVISPFTNIQDEHFPWIRQLLFNASLRVLRLTKTIEKLPVMSSEDLFLLRRDFVICIVTNDMAKQMNKDLASQISRSKSLGDFSVSTSKRGDSAVLLQIIKDSSDCMEEMQLTINDLEQSMVLPSSFVKGRYNPKTHKPARLWWHSELPGTIVDGFASKKYYRYGVGYKAGSFNLDHYSKYSHISPSEYYQLFSLTTGGDHVSDS